MSGAKISPQEGDLRPLHEDEPLPLPATEKTPIEIGSAKDLFKKAAKGKIRFENDDNEGPAIQQQVSWNQLRLNTPPLLSLQLRPPFSNLHLLSSHSHTTFFSLVNLPLCPPQVSLSKIIGGKKNKGILAAKVRRYGEWM